MQKKFKWYQKTRFSCNNGIKNEDRGKHFAAPVRDQEIKLVERKLHTRHVPVCVCVWEVYMVLW